MVMRIRRRKRGGGEGGKNGAERSGGVGKGRGRKKIEWSSSGSKARSGKGVPGRAPALCSGASASAQRAAAQRVPASKIEATVTDTVYLACANAKLRQLAPFCWPVSHNTGQSTQGPLANRNGFPLDSADS